MSPRLPGSAVGVTDDPWALYIPSSAEPWDLRRVVHLHRRAGFAATWGELKRDLEDGPGPSADRLLAGRSRIAGVPDNFEEAAARLAEAALVAADPLRLKGWWVFRMLCGPDPLGERLTLLWHNHFATSNLKVADPAFMWRQNELFRRHARGPFEGLLRAMLRDPALLVWLDAPENTPGHPNENLARELLELFSLGIGHYTEADVRQAARSLTGWRIIDGEARFIPGRHDHGEKSILDHRGPFDADSLAGLLLAQPSIAARLAWRLAGVFFGEGSISRPALHALAAGLGAHALDIGWAVATILRSSLFFAEANMGSRVLGPAEFVVGAARALELLDPPPNTLVLADWMARMGQDLFYPPNVGGWSGGRAWYTTRSAIARANFATALVSGETVGLPGPLDPSALAARHGMGGDRGFFARLLRGAQSPEVPPGAPERARRAIARLLSDPEAQRA